MHNQHGENMKRIMTILWISIALVISFYETTTSAQECDIKMVAVNWEPYYGATLENGGVITDLVSTAFKRVGYKPSVTYVPWVRALWLAEAAKKDVVLGVYYNEERDKIYHYSNPFFNIEIGFIVPIEKGITTYNSLKDLSNYRIGVNKGWAYTPEFDAADYLNKDEGRDQIISIRKFLANRTDIIAISINIFKYEISKMENHHINEFVVLDPILSKNPLHIMISRLLPDYKKIINDFNQGMYEIKADGTYDQILIKHGF